MLMRVRQGKQKRETGEPNYRSKRRKNIQRQNRRNNTVTTVIMIISSVFYITPFFKPLFYLVIAFLLSHKLPVLLQRNPASHVSDTAGPLLLFLFCLTPPLPLFLSFTLFRQEQKSWKTRHVSLARLSSHYEVLSISQQHYILIIQRHWNKAVCLFFLLRRTERIVNEKAQKWCRFQYLCN